MDHHKHHFLLVTYPAQGHINPALQFAKQLIRTGAHVTFATSLSAHRRMVNSPILDGLTYAPFSDGYDDGFNSMEDVDVARFISELKRRGSETLNKLILELANIGSPVTCLIYTLLLPWAAEVARELHVPTALLWIQPATVFSIYYYYFSGYEDVITKNNGDPSCLIELPGLPPLTCRGIPSFFHPSNAYRFALPTFEEQFKILEKQENPRVLVNTFDALELDGLTAVNKVRLVGIGPLIPSAFLDEEEPSDTSFGADLFRQSTDYIVWLNSKPESSVVYVSFGSISVLSKQQTEEIARGLLESGHPFLWVVRQPEDGNEEAKEQRDKIVKSIKEAKQEGMIVSWCSQVEVLSHPSVGCFVSHCGWNSTLESVATGVPVVAFPQWTDQCTNAMLIEDVWRTGVRVMNNNEKEGIVEGEELSRCVEIVMGGERGDEMRRNAKKWKALAREAVKEGGSSGRNLRAFVDEMAAED